MSIKVSAASNYTIKPSTKDIEQAKTTFGVVYPCHASLEGHYDIEFIIRGLKRDEYRRIIESGSSKSGKMRATSNTLASGVIFPKKEQLEALLEEYPAVADVVAGKILELSGVAEAELGKAY